MMAQGLLLFLHYAFSSTRQHNRSRKGVSCTLKQAQENTAHIRKSAQVAGLTVVVAMGLTVGVPLAASATNAEEPASASSAALDTAKGEGEDGKTESSSGQNQESGSTESPTTGQEGGQGAGEEKPANPTDPADPADPTDPTDPANPTDPTDPGQEPANPTDPVDPADPANPAAPADPSKEEKPASGKTEQSSKTEAAKKAAAAKKKAAADKAAAKKVTEQIKKLGTITLDKQSEVKKARKAYDALTKDQKKLVSNHKTLQRAESKIKVLKKQAARVDAAWSAGSAGVSLDGDLSIVDSDRSGQASDIVDIALAEPDGTPAGGSRNKYNLKSGQPWCAYYVIWCARKAGVPSGVIPTDPACRGMLAYFSDQHRAYGLDYTPQKGDLIFYAYTPGGVANHVGIVVSATSTTVTTREGNTSGGKVATHTFNRTAPNGRISGNLYILGYASPAYTNQEAAHEHSSWVETKAMVNEAQHKVTYGQCYCGQTRDAEKEDHEFAWKGSDIACTQCGASYVAHDLGEYVTTRETTVYESADASCELGTLEEGAIVEVTQVVLKGGEYFGLIEFDGGEGYLKLHDALANGDAGQHSFQDGVCQDCGLEQAASEPGVYEARYEAVTYNSLTGKEAGVLHSGQAVKVTQVKTASDNNYWGVLADGSVIRMVDLTLNPVDYGVDGTAVTDLPDGTYTINAAANFDLRLQSTGEEATGFSAALFGGGSALEAAPADQGSDFQEYQLIGNDNGTYTLVNVATGMALDAEAASKGLVDSVVGAGGHVGLAELSSGAASQQWYVEVMEDGTYAFRNNQTKRYLTCGGSEGVITLRNASEGMDQGFFLTAQDDVSSFAGNVLQVTGIADAYDYTGKDIEAAVRVRQVVASSVSDGVIYQDLEENTDYLLEYEDNNKVGTATVTVTGLGHLAGSVSKSFGILPKDVVVESVQADGATATVTWKPSTKVTGYQIMYSTSQDMTHAQTVKLKGAKVSQRKLSDLQPDSTYYVQVRSFAGTGKSATYGQWSDPWTTTTGQ